MRYEFTNKILNLDNPVIKIILGLELSDVDGTILRWSRWIIGSEYSMFFEVGEMIENNRYDLVSLMCMIILRRRESSVLWRHARGAIGGYFIEHGKLELGIAWYRIFKHYRLPYGEIEELLKHGQDEFIIERVGPNMIDDFTTFTTIMTYPTQRIFHWVLESNGHKFIERWVQNLFATAQDLDKFDITALNNAIDMGAVKYMKSETIDMVIGVLSEQYHDDIVMKLIKKSQPEMIVECIKDFYETEFLESLIKYFPEYGDMSLDSFVKLMGVEE